MRVAPSAFSHVPRELRVKRDGNSPGKANLPPMRVPAEHDVKTRVFGLAIDLRRVSHSD